jgi:F420H(2)-dependent biliverdin reductase
MRPNDPLVGHYLASSLVMRLATASGPGNPSLTPIWFVTVDGQLVSSTAATTVAARNIAAEPRVTVLLDGEAAGRSELVMRLRGTAEVHPGLPPLGVLVRFAAKYYLSRGGLRSELSHVNRWKLRARYYAQSEAVWLTIEPTAAELVSVPYL